MADANGVETNGDIGKRKSRGSLNRPSYAEASSSEDADKPLVCRPTLSYLAKTSEASLKDIPNTLAEQKTANRRSEGGC